MPLTPKQAKLLKTMTKGLISEVNEAFGRNNLFKALHYLQLAYGSKDNEFNAAINELTSNQREALTSFRDLYTNPGSIYLGQTQFDKNEIHSADIQNEIILILKAHENKLRSPTPLISESKETLFNWGRNDPQAERENQVELLSKALDLRPGDIIISEMAYEDAKLTDFQNFQDFDPGHTAIWAGSDFERPFAHSVREGYRPPGLKLSGLWTGRHMVFRANNDEMSEEAANIIRNWASAEKLYTEENYKEAYPAKFWASRHERDIKNYFSNESKQTTNDDSNKKIAGPATIFGEPRASYDLLDLGRDKNLAKLSDEGIRRAIKFAAMKQIDNTAVSKKGQRCTAIAVAAFQASILAPIVRQSETKPNFKQYKNKLLADYADEVLIDGWRETQLGKTLLECMNNHDYTKLFPAPFAVDQRYATPKALFAALKASLQFKKIGSFSFFNNELVKVEQVNSAFVPIQSPTSRK